jgi:hypothetical protein
MLAGGSGPRLALTGTRTRVLRPFSSRQIAVLTAPSNGIQFSQWSVFDAIYSKE